MWNSNYLSTCQWRARISINELLKEIKLFLCCSLFACLDLFQKMFFYQSSFYLASFNSTRFSYMDIFTSGLEFNYSVLYALRKLNILSSSPSGTKRERKNEGKNVIFFLNFCAYNCKLHYLVGNLQFSFWIRMKKMVRKKKRKRKEKEKKKTWNNKHLKKS